MSCADIVHNLKQLIHIFCPVSIRYACMCSVAQSCLTLCDYMECSPPGFSAHGIILARKLEWVAIFSFRGSSQSGIKPAFPALADGFFVTEPPGKPYFLWQEVKIWFLLFHHSWKLNFRVFKRIFFEIPFLEKAQTFQLYYSLNSVLEWTVSHTFMSLAWSLKLAEFALISSVTFPVSFLYLDFSLLQHKSSYDCSRKNDKINTRGNPNPNSKGHFPQRSQKNL